MPLRAYNPLDDLIIDFNSAMDRKEYVTAMTKLRALSKFAFIKKNPSKAKEISEWCIANRDYMLLYEIMVMDQPLTNEIIISDNHNIMRKRMTVNELRSKLIDLESQLHDYQIEVLDSLTFKEDLMGM